MCVSGQRRTRPAAGHLLRSVAGTQHHRPLHQGRTQHRLRHRAADLPQSGQRRLPAGQERTAPERHLRGLPATARCAASATGAASPRTRRAATRRTARVSGHPTGRARLRGTGQGRTRPGPHRPWQGRRARYRGTRKNLFDVRRTAVAHNLHVIARQPTSTNWRPDYLTGPLATSSCRGSVTLTV